MATASRETQQRVAVSGSRTQTINSVLRVSPAWRQRSRSYTPDQVLYRMGMRKNAQGEWIVMQNGVPGGLVDAMRGGRLKENASIKREASVEPDIYGTSGRERSVDLTDSAEVLDEIISMYVDVDEWVASHMDGDKMDIVMQSVEIKTDFQVDVDMGGVTSHGESGEMKLSGVDNCEGLASVPEEREEDTDLMDLDSRQNKKQDTAVAEAPGPQTPPNTKRRRKWSDPEIHYVGALLDGEHKLPTIVGLFHERFPHASNVTIGSLGYCRERILYPRFREHLKSIRVLAEELGLATGNWQAMDMALKEEEEQKLLSTQRALMKQQAQELASYQQQHSRAATETGHSKETELAIQVKMHQRMHQLFIHHRAQWRSYIPKRTSPPHEVLGADDLIVQDSNAIDYLTQLTILVWHANECATNSNHAWRNNTISAGYQHHLKVMVFSQVPLSTYLDPKGTMDWTSQLLFEYDMAMVLLQDRNVPGSEAEHHAEVLNLLLHDQHSLETLQAALKARMAAKEKQTRIEQLRERLASQQLKRILLFQQQRAGNSNLDAASPQEQETFPLEASDIIAYLTGKTYEEQLMTALVERNEPLETALRDTIEGGMRMTPLEAYQMQLMLLELQNKKRLLMARDEQDLDLFRQRDNTRCSSCSKSSRRKRKDRSSHRILIWRARQRNLCGRLK